MMHSNELVLWFRSHRISTRKTLKDLKPRLISFIIVYMHVSIISWMFAYVGLSMKP